MSLRPLVEIAAENERVHALTGRVREGVAGGEKVEVPVSAMLRPLLLAAMLEDEGAVVVRSSRRPSAAEGPEALLADLRDASVGEGLVRSVLDAHGRLDGVVVAAGVVAFGASSEVDDATLEADVGRGGAPASSAGVSRAGASVAPAPGAA